MITEQFYQAEREKAKAQATSSLTYDYIEALETVALAAVEVNASPSDQASQWKLYDALAVINFLDEDV